MHARELIQRGAKYYANHTGVIFQGKSLTFEQVLRRSNKLANALLRMGLKKGDRVASLLSNSLQSVEIDFALLLSGLVRVPLNTRLSENEHRHMINETDAKAILFTEEFTDRVTALKPTLSSVEHYFQLNSTPNHSWILSLEEIAKNETDDDPPIMVKEDDLATIQYTSGTTGTLKAAVHTQETWAAICNNILHAIRIEEGDVMLHAAPLTHASGTLVLPHWIRGAANAILPRFTPREFLEEVDKIKATTLNLVPTMIIMLLNDPQVEQYSFSSVRNIIYGASPMPREALRRGIKLWGAKFIQYYGQTEAPLILTLLEASDHIIDGSNAEQRLLSCGRATPNVEIKIVDENDNEVDAGNIGEIVVKTNQAMIGYWKAPELTQETIKHGWVYTRDMGYLDEQGYLYLVDRKSDMIITGGFNVYPREIEDILYQHPAVLEAAVVGVPDETWGETIKAFIVLREGFTVSEQDIIEYCKEHLASYKKPKSVEFVDELPKSPVGKVVRRWLRDPYWAKHERKI
ncbi:class I adenylate-forming enzyme family protein [Geobacillus sp. JS12]|uniref:class I adenylate-forming enzyme family protein n=1 Tax=Geobacillus sp. JS12 TaxID=1813182 RepID=UPI00078E6CB9|nr:long-chain fatty acid--CoA ligase [Geobacillus sp. JS12]AMQ20797.1 AMP-dependent synthetase [Geobacillus sp. JS12]